MKKFCVNCIYESLPHSIIDVPAETILFLEDEKLDHIYRIQSGLVKINRLHPSGVEKVFDILSDGDYIALLAVLQGQTNYIASAQTLTSTRLMKIAYQDVLDAYRSNNIFKETCLHCAVTRSLLFQSKLFQSTNLDIEEKILAVLQLLANKYGSTINGIVHLTLPFNKTILASIIGIARETLSRKLSQLKNDGIIEFDKNNYKFTRM